MLSIDTPHGPARVELRLPEAQPRAWLALGHGAGGGIGAGDLVAAGEAALAAGVAVALVEQPYRVAGRRSPAPAAQLDTAWLAVIAALRGGDGTLRFDAVPLIAGGRSSGARVACRTASAAGAGAVLCLAFPLHPPGKGGDPSKSRLPELEAVAVPTLVVQGERDPFGVPPEGPQRRLVTIPGGHSLRATGKVREAVAAWLETVAGAPA